MKGYLKIFGRFAPRYTPSPFVTAVQISVYYPFTFVTAVGDTSVRFKFPCPKEMNWINSDRQLQLDGSRSSEGVGS